MTNSQRPYGNHRTPLPPAQSPADGVPSPRTKNRESDRPAPSGKQRDAFFDNAKFLAPVGPGAQLRLALRELAGGNAVVFEIWQGPQLAAHGQLSRDDA